MQLEVGDVATEINVTAEAAVIVTETADVSTVRAGKYWTRNPSAQNTGVTFGQPTVSRAGGYFGYHGTREGCGPHVHGRGGAGRLPSLSFFLCGG